MAKRPNKAAMKKEIDDWHASFSNKYKGSPYGNAVGAGIEARHRGEEHWASKLSLPEQKITKGAIRKKMDEDSNG